jgi:hypothetical protein
LSMLQMRGVCNKYNFKKQFLNTPLSCILLCEARLSSCEGT